MCAPCHVQVAWPAGVSPASPVKLHTNTESARVYRCWMLSDSSRPLQHRCGSLYVIRMAFRYGTAPYFIVPQKQLEISVRSRTKVTAASTFVSDL